MKFLLVIACLLATASAHAQTRTYVCPVDGARVTQVGGDGQPSPKMYSDFEVPTDAYANRIVACPSCGYATWATDFERPVDGSIAAFAQQTLKKDAKRVVEPRIAWQHFVDLLHFRHAPAREQVTGLLYYTYVLKRFRPGGGQDYALEMQIKQVRTEVLDLLFASLKDDPPKSERARLEWLYLAGELTRLTGNAKRAYPLLNDVCELRDMAGNMVGNLACEMADRARRGECFEDYHGGFVDVTTAKQPVKAAELPTAASPCQPEPEKPCAPLPPMQREAPPRAAADGSAPPPPPIPK
jgi:hypothetical protein